MKLFIGTSGFSYQDWKGRFYPESVKPDGYLQYYSGIFSTVEINSSFYHFPRITTVNKWRDITPSDFLFAIKASRFITHLRKLSDSSELLINFFDILMPLNKKLGPILFQLPPQMKADVQVLKNFLYLLPENLHYSFEFRNVSWYKDDIFDLLKKHNCALCIHDHQDAPSPKLITADFTYLRFHGPDGRYLLPYSEAELRSAAEFIRSNNNLRSTYCFFNNDTHAYAVENALSLINHLLR